MIDLARINNLMKQYRDKSLPLDLEDGELLDIMAAAKKWVEYEAKYMRAATQLEESCMDRIAALEAENAELKEQRNEAIIRGNREHERANRLEALVREAKAWFEVIENMEFATHFTTRHWPKGWLNRANAELGGTK